VLVIYGTGSTSNAHLQLARDQGIFLANGLEVELAHGPGNAGPAALLSGQAQLMANGCAEALPAMAAGSDLVFLSTTTNRLDYVLAGGPTMPPGAGVLGKRLGVSRLGASSHLATKYMVKQLGLDPERDIAYVQVGNTPERLSALLSGSIDGAPLSVEEALLLGSQPSLHVVVDLTRETVPYCGNSFVMTRQYARENPDVVRRLVKSLVETIARFKLDQPAAMQSIGNFLRERDPQKLEHLWGVWAKLYPVKPYPDTQGLQFVIDELSQTDERARALTPDQLTDPRWIRELDTSGYVDSLYPNGAPP
jgi:ABC-type nitrate/sulfonate/bicarbonate transport system substrate-binding protein